MINGEDKNLSSKRILELMLTGSMVTLHRTGTSATTGTRPQLSGLYLFCLKQGRTYRDMGKLKQFA